jgi:peptidoglycan hydrolase-like protein with peptidoglycan-binding domain
LSVEGIDGKFGPYTKNSVMAYQKDNILHVDGIVGPQTWASLCKDVDFILSNNVPIPK